MSIKLYVEGGGDSKALRTACRKGFRKFIEKAGLRGRMPRIVACGGRRNAFESFAIAQGAQGDYPFLLVDAEAPVAAAGPWQHLFSRDGWICPRGATDQQCHLMVQVMESWLGFQIGCAEGARAGYSQHQEGPLRQGLAQLRYPCLVGSKSRRAGGLAREAFARRPSGPCEVVIEGLQHDRRQIGIRLPNVWTRSLKLDSVTFVPMPSTVRVHKYHGYGNDFLILWDGQVQPQEYSEFSRSVCRRHWGVGADGCVFLSPRQSNRFLYRIYNQDGSEAGLSGNGGRCASAFLHHRGLAAGQEVVLETRAGDKRFRLLEGKEPVWTYRSWLGEPQFAPSSIPFRSADKSAAQLERVQDYPLQAGGQSVRVTALWMGNPQCHLIADALPGDEEFRRLGAGLERHPAFPDRTNVGFVQVEGRHRLKLRIWERGVGPTQSSGTGSAAAAVAAIVNGKAESPVEVSTASGVQQVEWASGEGVVLTGQCRFVGQIDYCWESG